MGFFNFFAKTIKDPHKNNYEGSGKVALHDHDLLKTETVKLKTQAPSLESRNKVASHIKRTHENLSPKRRFESKSQKNEFVKTHTQVSTLVDYEVIPTHKVRSDYQAAYSSTRAFLIKELKLPCFICGLKYEDITNFNLAVDKYNSSKGLDHLKTYASQIKHNTTITKPEDKAKVYMNNFSEQIRMECHHYFSEFCLLEGADLNKWNKNMVPYIKYFNPLMVEYVKSSPQRKTQIYTALSKRGLLDQTSTFGRMIVKVDPIPTLEALELWGAVNPFNMMILCTDCHRGYGMGVHYKSHPLWISRMFLCDDIIEQEKAELQSLHLKKYGEYSSTKDQNQEPTVESNPHIQEDSE